MFSEHIKTIKSSYGRKPVFVGIYGSQNYGLVTEKSDIDVKSVVLPTVKELFTNKGNISTTLLNSKNEHCDVKDIGTFVNMLMSQNINLIESLFSKEQYFADEWKSDFMEIVSHREEIARYYPVKLILCAGGTAKKAFTKMADCHTLANVFRMRNFIEAYIADKSFAECLNSYGVYSKDYIIECRSKQNDDAVYYAARKELANIDAIISSCTLPEPNKNIGNFVFDWFMDISKKNMLSQLQ